MSKVSELFGKAGGVVKDLLPFASLIPGPWGAVAGGVSGMMAGSAARKKEDQLRAIQQRLAEEQAKIYEQYVASTTADLARTAGATIGPDGKPVFDPNFNPNAANAGVLFDPKNVESDMIANREATGRNYDNAIDSIYADSLGRGFVGKDSFRDSNVADVRRKQAESNASFDRGLLSDLARERREYLMAGVEKRDAARNQLLGFATGQGGAGNSGLGSLGNIYASRAGNAAAGVGQLAGVAGAGGGDFNMGGTLSDAINWFKKQTGWGGKGGFNYPTRYE